MVASHFAPEQELRIALVLYGGVSLAIYMYGVVEELHHLVQSTAPAESYADGSDPVDELLVAAPKGTEAIYRKLGRLLPGAEGSGESGPVRTRFVVDIISGTSAGGINGVCLAKALVNESPLDGLKKVWQDEGGIDSLINDAESDPQYTPPPASLLSGRRMLHTLVDALKGMNRSDSSATPPKPSRLVDELDLWVTATDLEGLDVPIRIANASISEKRHANRYRFHYAATDLTDDFSSEDELFLAYAARSTSAFPFAFDPAVLDDLQPYATDGDWTGTVAGWKRFQDGYDSARPAFAKRSFSDGGILDNKPFSYATQSLLARRSTTPVNRHLIYVEPDPLPLPDPAVTHKERWNAFDTAHAALAGIPRLETIREDLQGLLARNREIARVRDAIARMSIPPGRVNFLVNPMPTQEWEALTLEQTVAVGDWGPSYAIYHRLKVDAVADWVAHVVARASGFDSQSDHALAVRYLAEGWNASHYDERGEEGRETENALLLRFDVPYRIRRIDFVLQKLKEIVGADSNRTIRLLAAAGIEEPLGERGPERDGAARSLRTGLQDARAHLTAIESDLVSRESNNPLAPALSDVRITGTDLDSVLDAASHDGMTQRAVQLVEDRSAAFDALVGTLEERVRTGVERARGQVADTLGSADPDPLARALRFYYDTYEAYDLAVYPVQFGTQLGETNPVKVVRISPLDAKGPVGHERRYPKGIELGHFGAFLERSWRSDDMVWGRLDAAECLIGALLPEDHPDRASLIAEAHATIVRDYAEAEKQDPANAEQWFWQHGRVPDHPERVATQAALDRAELVAADVIEDVLLQQGGEATARLVKITVRPVLHATLGGGRTRAAVHALFCAALQNKWVKLADYVWGALALAGIALTAASSGVGRGIGLVMLAVTATLAGVVFFGTYVVVRQVRKAVATAIDTTVFGAPPKD